MSEALKIRPPKFVSSSPLVTVCRFQAYKYDDFFVPVNSLRKWRSRTFLLSVVTQPMFAYPVNDETVPDKTDVVMGNLGKKFRNSEPSCTARLRRLGQRVRSVPARLLT